jgi:hypothetical protein
LLLRYLMYVLQNQSMAYVIYREQRHVYLNKLLFTIQKTLIYPLHIILISFNIRLFFLTNIFLFLIEIIESTKKTIIYIISLFVLKYGIWNKLWGLLFDKYIWRFFENFQMRLLLSVRYCRSQKFRPTFLFWAMYLNYKTLFTSNNNSSY